ncbi:VWA domain-containing protein [bacterium]|nr:VWA domain-containing protein [bacterium]
MQFSFIFPSTLWLLLLIPITIGLALAGPRRPNKQRFYTGLVLRSFLLLSLILAIAGFQIHLKTDVLTTIFLLDVSDSIPAQQQEQAENIIRLAIQEMPANDRSAVILFGKDALVETLVSEEHALNEFTSIPITTQTNIADALQLALALFPNEGAKRIVLFSDGQENVGYALKQAEFVAANNAELLHYPIQGGSEDIEVLLDRLIIPSNARVGEQFQLTAVVNANTNTSGTLVITQDGNQIYSEMVNLSAGNNEFSIPISAEESGFHRFKAQIIPDPAMDYRLQNNEVSSFINITGPQKVLIVEGQPGEGTNLTNALSSADFQTTLVSPSQMGSDLQTLSTYDTIIFVDVPANSVPDGVMEALQSYVRDLGKGFIMVGGENAYGAGGYLRTPIEEILPVNMDVKSKELTANLALILAIDKSGSMGRCHCDDPDLNQSYVMQEVGQPKVDIAKEAVMRSASALGTEDYLGVVAFDDSAKWAIEASPLPNYTTIENAIGGITANGPTNITSGVEAAYEALQSVDAKRKHIILLTDGWSHTGDITPLVEEMAANGITFSIVAAGGGSAEYLEALANAGEGRYYPATDILSVPDIFLKETVQSVGEYIIEEAFYPLPNNPGASFYGIDTLSLPALLGYNGTTPKTAARLDLITPKGDPLLATWQYGLGRSAAWTSDMKGQWGESWITWDGYAKFVSQLVNWVAPEQASEFFQASAALEGNQAAISLSIQNESGQPVNQALANATIIDPDLNTQEIPLEQVGAGEYQAVVDIDDTGTYMIRVGANDEEHQSLGQQTIGLVAPYSPEYRASALDLAKLVQLSEITGGGELTSPEEAFLHNLPSASFAVEIWRPLLLIVTLLFPLDVAIRRLIFDRSDIQKAKERVTSAFSKPAAQESTGPRVLENLFEARNRVRDNTEDQETPQIEKAPTKPAKSPSKPMQPPKPATEQDDLDTFSRLRQAKRRAGKDNPNDDD